MKRLLVLVLFAFINLAYALPNPASVYCEKQGGSLQIVDTPGGSVGICLFAYHGKQSCCEEWSYFRGNCRKGDHPIDQHTPLLSCVKSSKTK